MKRKIIPDENIIIIELPWKTFPIKISNNVNRTNFPSAGKETAPSTYLYVCRNYVI
jgi:hypothetical protein